MVKTGRYILILFLFMSSLALVFGTVSLYHFKAAYDGSYTNDLTPSFAFYTKSTVNVTYSCELFIDGTGFGVNSTVSNFSRVILTANASLSVGSHVWNITCTDADGAVSSTQSTFTIETTSPSVVFDGSSVVDGYVSSSDTVSLNISVSDSLNHSTYVDFNGSLTAYYSFDSYNSTHVLDGSSYGRDALFAGSPSPLIGFGVRGSALDVSNPFNDYVYVPTDYTQLISTTTGTISAWIRPQGKPLSIGNGASYFSLPHAVSGSGVFNGFGIAVGNRTDLNQDRIWVYNRNATSVYNTIGINYTADEWVHIVWRHNGSMLYAYKNGELVGSTVSTATYGPLDTDDVYIGWGWSGGATAANFNGSIDEVMFFNRALDDFEIKALYDSDLYAYEGSVKGLSDGSYSYYGCAIDQAGNSNCTSARTFAVDTIVPTTSFISPTEENGSWINTNSLIVNVSVSDLHNTSLVIDWNRSLTGYWNFDNVSGTLVYDSSSYGHTASLQLGAYVDDVNGVRGNYAQFNGINRRVSTGVTLASYITAQTGTISLWMKPTGAIITDAMVYNLPSAVGDFDAYVGILVGNYTGLDRIWVYNYDLDSDAVGIEYTSGEWAHIVWVHENGRLYAYKNGVYVGNVTSGNTGGLSTELFIGQGFATNFNGSIDEVMLFKRALSATEIKALYDSQVQTVDPSFSSLSDGTYAYTACSIDEAGNYVCTQERTVTVDTNVPTSTIITPSNGIWVNDTTPEISFTLTDALDSLLNYTVFINSFFSVAGTVTSAIQSYLNLSVLSEGLNSIQVEALDDAGNVINSTALNLNVDSIQPLLTFVSPTESNGSIISSNATTINVSLTETNNASSYIDLDATLVGYWSFEEYNSTHVFDLSSYGHHGVFTNGVSVSNITQGVRGSALDFDGVNDHILVSGNTYLHPNFGDFTVEFWYVDLSDAGDTFVGAPSNALQSYWYIRNNTAIFYSASATTVVDVYYDLSDDGDWHHFAAVLDRATSPDTLSIYLDGTLLVSNQGTLDDDRVYGTGSLRIGGPSWIGSGYRKGLMDEVKIHQRALSIDEIKASYNTKSYQLQTALSDLSEGSHSYYACSRDIAGNYNCTDTQTFVVDTILPTSTIHSVYGWHNDNTPELNFTIADMYSSVLNYTVYVDTGINVQGTASSNVSTLVNLSTVSEGFHAFKVEAVDEAGNKKNSTQTLVIIDSIPPSSTIDDPQNGTWTKDSTPSFNFTMIDAQDISLNYKVYVDGVLDSNGSTTSSLKTARVLSSSLSDGMHIIEVESEDEAFNHLNSTPLTLYVDSHVPSLSYESGMYANGSSVSSNSTQINISVTDYSNTSLFVDWNRSLVGYWSFESYNSSGIYDNSTYNGFGTFQNGMSVSNITQGVRGNGILFDGVLNYVNLGNYTHYFEENESFSVSFWFQSNGTSSTYLSNTPAVFEPSWYIARSLIYFINPTFQSVALTPNIPLDNNMHHAVVSLDRTVAPNVLTFYLDGQFQNSSTGTLSYGRIHSGKNLFMGRASFAAAYMKGVMDEVMLFNRVLSSSEVASLYDSSANQYQQSFSDLADGTYTYYGCAIDYLGNQNCTYEYTLTLDVTLPNSVIQSPLNNTITSDTTPELIFVVSDALSGTLNYTLYVDGVLNLTGSSVSSSQTYVNVSALSQGVHIVQVQATDAAGNSVNSTAITLTVDSEYPVVEILSPTNGTVFSQTQFELQFAVTDSIDTTLNYTVFVDGTIDVSGSSLNASTVYYNISSLTSGEHVVQVEAHDDAFNRINSTALFVYVDQSAPIVTFVSPTSVDNYVYTTNYTYVNATITDSSSTSSYVDWQNTLTGYWSFDNYNVTGIFDNSSYGRFAYYKNGLSQANITNGVRGNALMFDGMNDYIASSGTNMGLYSDYFMNDSLTISLWMKPTGPVVQKAAPAFLPSALGDTFNGLIGISFGNVSGNNKLWLLSNSALVNTTYQMDVWTHVVLIVSGDTLYGYKDGVLFGTESGALQPFMGADFQVGKGALAGSYFNGELDEVMIFNRSLSENEVKALYDSTSYGYDALYSSLVDGVYTYVVHTVDAAGNRGNTSMRTRIVDTTPPSVEIISPSNNTYTSDSTPEISFRLIDNYDSLMLYGVYVDGGVETAGSVGNNTILSLNLSALSDGVHTFYVIGVDDPSNIGYSQNYTLIVDTGLPSSTINYPNNNTWVNNQTFELGFTLIDSVDSVLNYTVYIDGVFNVSSSTLNNTLTALNLTLSEGMHALQVEARDTTGNAVNSTILFATIDTTLPEAVIHSPVTSWVNDQTPEFNITLTDNLATVLNYSLYFTNVVKSTGTVSNGSITLFNASSSSEGGYLVYLEAQDLAGNKKNSTPIALTIDVTSPTSVIDSAINGMVTSDTTPAINFTLTDNMDSTISYIIWVDGVVDSSVGSPSGVPVSIALAHSVSDGAHTIIVEAIDDAGNRVNSTATTIYVDTTAPVPVLDLSFNGTWISSSSFELNFTLSDGVDSLINYSIYLDGIVNSSGSQTNGSVTYRNVSLLTDGVHTIVVEAFDDVGFKANSSVLTLYVDTQVPTATIFSPVNATVTLDTTPELGFILGDAQSSVLNYTVFVDSILDQFGTSVNGSITYVNLSALADGAHQITVEALDQVGHAVNSSVLVLSVDTQNPYASLTYPTNNANTSDRINFTFTSSDSIDAYLNYTLFIDGVLNHSGLTAGNNVTTAMVVDFIPGVHNWSVIVIDDMNHTYQTLTAVFTVFDTTPPSSAPVLNQSGVNDTDLDGNIELSWAVDTNATTYRVYRSSTQINDASSLTALIRTNQTSFEDNTTMHNQTYWYAITSIDSSGNENTSLVSQSFNATALDTRLPRLPVSLTATSNADGSITLNWDAVTLDVLSQYDVPVRYQIYRTTNISMLNVSLSTYWLVNTTLLTYTDTSLVTGVNYTYSIVTVDDADNRNTSVNVYDSAVGVSCSTSWSAWSDWSTCSLGTQTRERTRTCYGGGLTLQEEEQTCASSMDVDTDSLPPNPVSSQLWSEIEAFAPMTMAITREEIPITQVSLAFTSSMDDIGIRIEKLAEAPAVGSVIQEEVYLYLSITKEKFTNDDLMDMVTINFKVEKNWMIEQHIDVSRVVLKRYVTDWEMLPTRKVAEDARYIYYESESRGFSYFAISVMPSEPIQATVDDVLEVISNSSVVNEPDTVEVTTIERVPEIYSDYDDTQRLIFSVKVFNVIGFTLVLLLFTFLLIHIKHLHSKAQTLERVKSTFENTSSFHSGSGVDEKSIHEKLHGLKGYLDSLESRHETHADKKTKSKKKVAK